MSGVGRSPADRPISPRWAPVPINNPTTVTVAVYADLLDAFSVLTHFTWRACNAITGVNVRNCRWFINADTVNTMLTTRAVIITCTFRWWVYTNTVFTDLIAWAISVFNAFRWVNALTILANFVARAVFVY